MASIDQQFVEYIVKTLVNNPDKVSIDREIDEKGVLLSLSVDPEDIGRVIGKKGATAQAMRTLLRALGTKNDARYNLKIVDTDGGREEIIEGEPTAVRQAPDVDSEEEALPEEENSAFSEQTRKELEDLDDLEI